MKTIKGYILLMRPVNMIIAFLSIFMGGFVTGAIHPLDKLLLACLSGIFIMGGANSINDYFDLEIDRINKPKRPLPADLVEPKKAKRFAILLFQTGVILGLFINPAAFMISLTTAVLLYFYSSHIKKVLFWSNVTVAFVLGLAFVYGGVAVGLVQKAVIVGVFAFLFNLAREIIKDIEDVEGDGALGIDTLPLRFGVRKALYWATGTLVIFIGLSVIPYFLNVFSLYYLIVVVAGVDVFLVYILISMWRNSDQKNMGRLSFLMRLNMFICLIAVYLGN